MKFIIASVVFAVLLMECQAFLKPVKPVNPGLCVINSATCADTAPVCARFGGSNLCKNFLNQCDFQIANCQSKSPYHIVDDSFCVGIGNQRTFCNGLGTANVVNKPIWNKPIWNKPIVAKPIVTKPILNKPGIYVPVGTL